MASQLSPFVEANYGWPFGSSGWNDEMDQNLVKFSYLHDRNIDAIVSSLPAISNGSAYFNTSDNRLYFDVNGQRYSSVTPKWFEVTLRSTGEIYLFDGSTLNLTQRVGDLANEIDPSKGAALVGWDGEAISSQLNLSKKLVDYTTLRAYTGEATRVEIISSGTAGDFISLGVVGGYTDNGGTCIIGADGRVWERLYDGPIYAEWFGTKADNVTDDAPAINAAIDSLAPVSGPALYGSGGVVVLPAGRIRVKSPINVKFGITLVGRGSDIYQSNISVDPTFIGEAAVVVRSVSLFSYTNGHVKSVGISCNNVPGAGGILYAGAYNNCSIEDCFVLDVHGGSIGIEVRPMTAGESASPTTVCESLLLKDLYVIHYDDPTSVIQPTIKLTKCQESTLINVKAFSARNKSSPLATNQSAMIFEDCRGITVIGGASVGSKYGITISAVTRNSVGFKIAGFTYELVTDYALNCVGTSPSIIVTAVDHDIPRYETPMPTNGLYAEYTQNCDIHTGIKGAVLGLGVTGINLEDFGSGTVTADATARYVRRVAPNAVNNRTVLESSAGVEIHATSTPGFRFTAGARSDYWTANWAASDAVNNGFRIAHSSGRAAITTDDSGTASKIGFLGATPVIKPVITGAKGGNAALTSLLTQLATLGLITDSTT